VTDHLPRALLVDLDDTILNDSAGTADCWKDACVSCRSEVGNVDPDRLYGAIEKTRAWYWSDPDRHRVGRLDLDAAAREVVRLSLDELGVSDSVLAATVAARYRAQREARLAPFPGAVETLLWFRESGCRLALVTNGGAAMQRGKIARFGLGDLFDAILVEGQLGFGKPDPRTYQLALKELAVTPVEAWMVGDNLEWDVAQPQRMGLLGIWVDVRGAGLPDANGVRPDRIVRRLSDLRTPRSPE
jgi:putative hydrolase of the HAD superfamily